MSRTGAEDARDPTVLVPGPLRALVVVLGGSSVASLLAWVYDLGSFRSWALAVSLPGQLALIAVAVVVTRRSAGDRRYAEARTMLVAGLLAGLLGTLGYDLFRVPFVLAGHRLLAPIDSYGVLAAGVSASSQWTGLLGWTYHVANGVGFGLAYAMLASRRHWAFGVAWALLLETATIVTPFASVYGLRGDAGFQLVPIAIAYAAHVPYGLALGRIVQRPDGWVLDLRRSGRFAVPVLLGGVVVSLMVWLRPWAPGPAADGRAVAAGASALVVDGRFEPQWLRVAPGGCVVLDNRDATPHELSAPGASGEVGPGVSTVCFTEPGVHRVRFGDEPYAGGFVIVDRFG